jgi:large repetitive protein
MKKPPFFQSHTQILTDYLSRWTVIPILLLGMITNSFAQSPGGVTGASVWLKANAGTSTTTDGSTIATWNDQSGNSRTHTQPNGTVYQPLYKENVFNYNPAVYFDGLDGMQASAFASGTDAVHVFAMSKVKDNGWRSIYGFGRDASHVQWYNGGLANKPSVWLSGNNYPSTAFGLNYGVTSYILPKDGSQKTVHWNGTSGNITGINNYTFNSTLMGVGTDLNNFGNFSENFYGEIAEVIIYKKAGGGTMNTVDIQKIQSYLGIKYGITLSHDYLDATGATVYVLGTYNKNVFGIARDDAQGLYQKQSKSYDAEAYVSVSNATTFATSNAANASTLANNSFEMIGDNGLSTSYSVAYAPSTFTPVGNFLRMSRVWKVQETGTVGTITLSVPVGADKLLVSSSATFGAGTQEIALTPDGNGNATVQIDLTSGQFLSFGKDISGPGCVSADLKIWLKADAGVSGTTTASQWTNQGPLPYNLTQATATSQPTYATSGSQMVNFNPSLYFDGGNFMFNNTSFMSGTTPYTFMMMAQDEAVGLGYRTVLSTGDIYDYFEFNKQGGAAPDNGWVPYGVGGGGAYGDRGNFGKGTKYSPAGGANGFYNGTNFTSDVRTDQSQAQILGFGSQNSAPTDVFNTWTDGYKDTPAWSFINESVGLMPLVQAHFFKNLSIGGDFGGNVEPWIGKINEMIVYNRSLTDVEAQRINSYLAIKYGVTLGQGNGSVGKNGNNVNYLSGGGAIIWNATANSTYNFDITGVGQDDCQGLIQKQSKSINPTSFVTIGNGTGIAATNAANLNLFSADKSFEIVGDNGLTKDYAVSYAPTSFTPASPFFRMNRIWKVQETGTVGMVTISIPGTTERLLVSGSNAFGAGTQEIVMTPDGNGNSTAQVNLTDGQFFTFGKAITAPGCVVTGLQYWFDAAESVVGGTSSVTGWTDKNSGVTLNKNNAGTITSSLGDAQSNFNPYVLFPSNAHLTGIVDPVALGRLHTTFVLAQKDANIDATYNHAFRFGAGPGTAVTHDYGVGTVLNLGSHYPVHHWLSKGTTVNRFHTGYPISFGTVGLYGARINSITSGSNKDVSFNGNTQTYSDAIIGNINANMQIGGSIYGMQGRIPEVVYYNVALTDAERNRVDTYFGVKYGLTLTHNYLSGAGTTIYDITTYGKNITGIGRDDCQDLKQKQSKSVETDGLITLGIDNQITTTNATHTGAFDTDKSFLIIGDDGAAAGTLTTVTPGGACSPPETVDKFTSRIWKSVESGSVESTKLSVDLSSYGFSTVNPVYMQVGTDAAFTSFSNVLMVKNGLNYETSYDFTGTQYLRFAGTTALPPANACSGDKTFEWNTFPSYWNWGQTSRTSTFGDTQFAVTITDPNGAIYAPSVYPVGQWWWNHIFIPRYDANGSSNKITTKIVMNKAANKASFEIFDIDEYFGKDVVNVYGKLGGVQVNPKITFPANSPLTATTSGTGAKISATTGIWDISAYGKAYVNFNNAVDEIIIEYTKDNGWAFKSYQDIRIRNIDIQCKPFSPEVPLSDNVYMSKQVVGGTTQKVDEAFTYKFTVTNLDCASKTINILDGLPSGLTFVDSTLATSLVSTSVNSYGGGSSLNMTGVVVPPGTSYIYVDAKGMTAGTFDNQADFTVGANSYLSDDPAQVGASNPTPVTLVANRPLANLVITKTVDKATAAQNEVIKYTYKIDNPNATAILTTFQDNLPATTAGGPFKYVAGTLTGIGSAIVTPTVYGGESSLTLRNLSIPASGSLTFTVDVNTSGFTTGQTGKNVASVTPDPGTIYRDIPYYSGQASTLIGACVAGTTAPTLSATTKSNVCPATTADISSLVSSTCPVGSSLEWHNVSTGLSAANKVTNPVSAGTYYPVCFDATNACYSPAPTTGVTVTITTCSGVTFTGSGVSSGTVSQNATPGQMKSGSASMDLVPTGGTPGYVYTNGSSDPLCVNPGGGAMALPAASNLLIGSNGSYSYTAPATPGTYYFCVKVCDSASPTPVCSIATYKVTVAPPACVVGTAIPGLKN